MNLWRVSLAAAGRIGIAGELDAAVALRDAINSVIEQAGALPAVAPRHPIGGTA